MSFNDKNEFRIYIIFFFFFTIAHGSFAEYQYIVFCDERYIITRNLIHSPRIIYNI